MFVTNYTTTRLDEGRYRGFATAKFPGLPCKRDGDKVYFSLAMGRKVLFDLAAGTWVENSPKGRAAGRFDHSDTPLAVCERLVFKGA